MKIYVTGMIRPGWSGIGWPKQPHPSHLFHAEKGHASAEKKMHSISYQCGYWQKSAYHWYSPTHIAIIQLVDDIDAEVVALEARRVSVLDLSTVNFWGVFSHPLWFDRLRSISMVVGEAKPTQRWNRIDWESCLRKPSKK